MPGVVPIKQDLYQYDIYPKIIAAHKKSTITIESLDYSTRFDGDVLPPLLWDWERKYAEERNVKRGEDNPLGVGNTYTVEIMPLTESPDGTGVPYDKFEVVSKDNKLVFMYEFGIEQEYYVKVRFGDKELVKLSVYALMPDLLAKTPLVGDFHVHTCLSDGRESPEFVAARYRQIGFDFISITDHGNFAPSVRAIDFYKDAAIDFKLYTGEEVHSRNNHLHLVNFGGDYGINELCWSDCDKYMREVEEIAKTVQIDGINKFEYAACTWVYEQIRKANGMCIFAHPHWIWGVYHAPDKMIAAQFENKLFDAFELLGGQSASENNCQLAFYNDSRANGITVPIVGSSDSHGSLSKSNFNEAKTIVFAESNTRDAIINAVKGLYSVAVENRDGERHRIHGSYRLTKYSLFLMEHLFPLKEQLCFEEGRAMLEYVRKAPGSGEYIQTLSGRTDKLMAKYIAK